MINYGDIKNTGKEAVVVYFNSSVIRLNITVQNLHQDISAAAENRTRYLQKRNHKRYRLS
jgi:hypothetical protein